MARTRARTFREVPLDTRAWDKFFKDFLDGLEDVDITELGDVAGNSVMGRAPSTAGQPAAITATVNGHVLRLSGGVLGFGTITSASLSDFTEATQDIIGAALTDSASINFTYDDGAGTATAVVLPAGVDHDSLANFAADEHVAHTSVTFTAGAGLTGGGDISTSRNFDVGAGTGITVNANDVAINLSANFPWTGRHDFAGGITGSLLSPAQITANQNDYSPAGFLAATIIRLSSDASRNITGLARDGQNYIKIVCNIGAQNIVFTNEDGASTANQRLALKGAVSYTLAPGAAVVLFYDGTSDRWRIALL